MLENAAAPNSAIPVAFRRDAQKALAGAHGRSGADLAQADVAVSEALAAQVARAQPDERALNFVDPQLQPTVGSVLYEASQAPSLTDFLQSTQRINPIYDALRAQFQTFKSRWSALPQVPIPSGPRLSLGDQGARVDLLRRRLGAAPAPGRPYDGALESRVRPPSSAPRPLSSPVRARPAGPARPLR